MKHKRFGFTIVEMIVVVVIIGLLASITTIAYRATQKSARDEKRKIDVAMLMGALAEYRADKGTYPKLGTCTGSSNPNECWSGEVWTMLKNEGYINDMPMPEMKITATGFTDKNVAPDGTAFYGYYSNPTLLAGDNYGIYVPRESGDCKDGKNYAASWWSSVQACNF